MDTRRQLIMPETKLRSRVKKKKTKWPWFLVALLAVSLSAYQAAQGFLRPYSSTSASVQVEIPLGSSPGSIGRILADQKLIHSPKAFSLYTRWKGLNQDLKAGTYTLDPSWPLARIAFILTQGGRGAAVTFTIPEGFNLEQIAQRLEETGLVKAWEFLQVAETGSFHYDFLRGLPTGKQRLEGFLFPDTYQVKTDATPEQIINLMLKRFGQIYTAEFKEREEEIGLTTLEIVSLASIVEKEVKLDSERATVAGIFYNRIREKWYLQSCATVQYLLDEPREELLNKDLEIDSPYNTYKYAGLPPGPIASPGRASLEAVLYPAEVEYMFFRTNQAKGDGSHIFSRTLAEHNKAGK